jgi:hypothetical protein
MEVIVAETITGTEPVISEFVIEFGLVRPKGLV